MATTAQSIMNTSFSSMINATTSVGKKNSVSAIAASRTQSLFDSLDTFKSHSSLLKSAQRIQLILQTPGQGQQPTLTQQILSPNISPPTFQVNPVPQGFAQRLTVVPDPGVRTVQLSVTAQVQMETMAQAGMGGDVQAQADANTKQAQDINQQLNLGSSAWGVESLGQDLAVFGLDFTAFTQNGEELLKTVHDKSLEMIAKLDADPTLDKATYDAQRRVITGASARLTNGIQKASGLLTGAPAASSTGITGISGRLNSASSSASFSVTSSVSSSGLSNTAPVNVRVNGTNVSASAVIAVANVIADPLVLDLNGDGINLTSAEEGVQFDLDGDGTAKQTAFIQGDDAFLFIDSHNDGLVHDGKQLFGNQDGYANGFDQLRAFDSNNDGVIDELDEVFDSLRLWVEKNGNGVCEEGETMSLREAGIKSINLNYANAREDDGKGNLIAQKSSFTRTDGSTGLAADAWLQEL